MSVLEQKCGYLEVKISSKSRRRFTPWKAWQKQWCEIRQVDHKENGVELMLKTNEDGNILNKVILPISSTICRTESRTKRYAFGVYMLGETRKPLLFLSGSSESDSQEWMFYIRRLLSPAQYISVGQFDFHVSLVDNSHSRASGLVGTFGLLNVNKQELIISDPCTAEAKITWKWLHFHQFHLQASPLPVDDKKILVMHTSGEFPSGPGQLYLYCKQGTSLLQYLIARGQMQTESRSSIRKRLSRSEGDLSGSIKLDTCNPDSLLGFRSQSTSDDSGVRVSVASDDFQYTPRTPNICSFSSINMTMVTKTPGGSETENSLQDLIDPFAETTNKGSMPRNESGISLASGIYEEIIEDMDNIPKIIKTTSHLYENPIDVILECRNKYVTPPPLPPRRLSESDSKKPSVVTSDSPSSSSYKPRCNTMPATALSKISHISIAEPEYEVMSPRGVSSQKDNSSILESFYMPMSPINQIKNKLESCYISMVCKRT